LRALVYQQTYVVLIFVVVDITNEVERAWKAPYSDWVWAECPGYSFQQKEVISLFTIMSIPALEPAQPTY
jgi:hypothetical protein